jgi:S-adenosylmethionine:tRNA ribosyltransferase-isomerase
VRRQDFSYDLPEELIAQSPLPERSASRLLVLDGATGGVADRMMRDLPGYLRAGDLLVFNDTRVVAARVVGAKPSGGRVEIFLERVTAGRGTEALVQLRASKPIREGLEIATAGGVVRVLGRENEELTHGPSGLWRVQTPGDALEFFEAWGEVPLPPYIHRPAEAGDRERYQSIFARQKGAVAAPTASLHFDEPLVAKLEELGVGRAFVTLHVGAGTFQPLRTDDLDAHKMHAERVSVSRATWDAIGRTRAAGGRVVAVGTTVVRALESAALAIGDPVASGATTADDRYVASGRTGASNMAQSQPSSAHGADAHGYGGGARDHGAEVRGDGAEVRGHGAEVRGDASDVRGHGAEVQGRSADVCGHGAQVRGYGAEPRGDAADVRGQGAEVQGRSAEVWGHGAEVRGYGAEARGHAPEVRDEGAEGGGHAAEVRGQGAAVRSHSADVRGHTAGVRSHGADARDRDAEAGGCAAWSGETRLFIQPGFKFRVVDAMVTNFHLPESTLLMLVSAFAGRENVLAAYAHAVRERYRFFSYGDAMFVLPAKATLGATP